MNRINIHPDVFQLASVVTLFGFAAHVVIKTGHFTFAFITLGVSIAILVGGALARKFDKLP
jgi:hypothetical protein